MITASGAIERACNPTRQGEVHLDLSVITNRTVCATGRTEPGRRNVNHIEDVNRDRPVARITMLR